MTPESLRKLCGLLGALEGSVGLWPHSGFKGVEPLGFQNLRGSAGALGAPEPFKRSGSAVRAVAVGCGRSGDRQIEETDLGRIAILYVPEYKHLEI